MNWISRTSLIFILPVCIAWPVAAASPSFDFPFGSDDVFFSPDKTLRIEAWHNKDYQWQFWCFDPKHHDGYLLNPGETKDHRLSGYVDETVCYADYPAGFRLSADEQWLVRMQKLGAGTDTLFLYRRERDKFMPATKKPLGEMAWDYFWSLPESKSIALPVYHDEAGLIRGFDENYRWMGEHWPENRYVVITLACVGADRKVSMEGWHCLYDLQTGRFSVPSDFAGNNAQAIKMEK